MKYIYRDSCDTQIDPLIVPEELCHSKGKPEGKMRSFLLIIVLCGALSCAWPVLQNTEQATEKDTQLVEVRIKKSQRC